MADVDSTLTLWSTTASSNKPTGATTIGTGLDDNLRTIQSAVRSALYNKGSDIASASTADLAAATTEGLFHDITGTTTITSLGTAGAGVWKVVRFTGALTLTYNATSLILPSAGNITTAAGDIAIFYSLGSGNWVCANYQPAAVAMVNTGIKFPASWNSSSNANTLDDYDEYTAASANCTGAITTAAVWKLTKVGNVVTLTLPATSGTASATSTYVYGTAIPSKYRPAADVHGTTPMKNNGAYQSSPGAIFVSASTGVIQCYRLTDFTSNFVAGAAAGTDYATTISWTI